MNTPPLHTFGNGIKEYLHDFVGLFFPSLCCVCEEHLVKGEHLLCLTCYHDLPFTDFHLLPDNVIAKRFWGRVNIESATSLLHFQKGNKVQQLVHQLKYTGREDVGIYLGEMMGKQLKESDTFKDVGLVVPVPLHWRKHLIRGYNQSACFGEGIASAMGVESNPQLLRRAAYTQTQTKKTREERWHNVKDVFALHNAAQYQGKHILLVDDVVTTGATLEACAQKLLTIPGTKVSLATIAVAE
ncbi:ComF family protein [soil metagenome]